MSWTIPTQHFAWPDAWHGYPLAPQGNLAHVCVVIPHGTTDAIIHGHVGTEDRRGETVFAHPDQNRQDAIKVK